MPTMTELAGLHVVFDSADPDRVSKFWMTALPGYDFPQPPPEGFETWEQWADANSIPLDQRNQARTLVDTVGNRPTIFFNQVSESKSGKNRLHLDIKVAEGLSGDQRRTRIEFETDRLLAAGAEIVKRVDDGDGFWTVMRDVEGNEFCVI
jgi:hypothetical protein